MLSPAVTAAAAVLLAIVHLFAGRLRFLDRLPRSRWLSAAGGVSVAYVFMHVLPELTEHHQGLVEGREEGFIVSPVFLVALIGLVVFYSLEQWVRREKPEDERNPDEDQPRPAFWVHIASFTAYNALVGYLLVHRESEGAVGLFTFALALGLHFVVNDYGLRQHHQHIYHNLGRWILSAAVIAGWVVGQLTEISDTLLAFLFAFLAGGIILNTLKEELPSERESRVGAFALGVVGYSLLMVLV